jgi:hypothetical protein
MVKFASPKTQPTCPASFEAGRQTARRLMKLVIAREQLTGSLLRPTLARLLVEGKAAGYSKHDLVDRVVLLIRAYLVEDSY